MPKYDYDLIVIGGGAAGLVSSKLARGLGKKVALIEKNKLGGECTWTGCVPSKTLIKSAQASYIAHHIKKYGLLYTSATTVDVTHVLDHVRSVVKEVATTHTSEEIRKIGIDVIIGSPIFQDKHSIKVQNKVITSRNFIIATGSSPSIPAIDGLEGIFYYTNQTFFDSEKLPKSMIIIGGGAVGCELASALNRLGVDITIIESHKRLLPKEDKDVVTLLEKIFTAEGIKVETGIKATKITKKGDKTIVTTQGQHGYQKVFDAEKLFVAVGRRSNVEGLGLDAAGVQVEDGRLIVDKTLRTSANNIYACGDVVGPYLFSHMAYYQASIATQNAFLPWYKKVHYDHVVWVTFTAPEIASAGLTEKKARELYKNAVKVYTVPYSKLDRSHNDRNLEGFGKFVCDSSGVLLGAHIIGPSAGELIHEVQLAKTYGMRLEDMYKVIHAYPTYSELIWHAARMAYLDRIKSNMFVRFMQKIRKLFSNS